MKAKVLTVISVTFVAFGVLSNGAMADDQPSAEQREAHRQLKREQRQEHRALRREHRAQDMLMRVDENKDGQVDLNEYLAHAQERFNKLDLDSNGFVTPDEAKESMKVMREEHKLKRKEMREKRGRAEQN